MEGGGKAAAYYHHHHDAKLLKTFRHRFGVGLVAGFLLVTFAYLSTAKFDAIQIAIISSSPSANAFDGSKPQSDLGLQDQDALSIEAKVLDKDDNKFSSSGSDLGVRNANASVGEDKNKSNKEKKGETSARSGGDASGVPPNGTVGGAKDDDDTLLPPLSSEESANSTQQLADLAAEDLQVEETPPKKKISSNNGSISTSVVPSDPATLPVLHAVLPGQQIPATPPVQIPHVPEVKKQTDWEAPLRDWKPLCDLTSNRRIDWCELDGDVRVLGANGTVTLVAPPGAVDESTFRAESWRIKPYPRKADANAMRHLRELTVQSLPPPAAGAAPACTDWHDVPALVFSDRGYTGNYFHAFTDVILPLFLTAKQYNGEVQFMVSDFQMWWVGKFLPVFKSLSNYDLIDLAADRRVHCFRHVQVGLTCHADFSIDPRRAPNNYSMVDFTRHMRATYNLPRGLAAATAPGARPRLLVIARARTRRFMNLDEIVRGAEKAGFEAVVSEGNHEVAPFAELANSCDAMLGVHGAGLTNMVFIPTGGVVIQVVPFGGLDFVAGYFRGPSRDMGLKYLEYSITPEESTLIDQYPRDHAIFTDPDGVKSKGWDSLKEAYLEKQDVRLNMKRFRPLLKKAIAHLRQNKLR